MKNIPILLLLLVLGCTKQSSIPNVSLQSSNASDAVVKFKDTIPTEFTITCCNGAYVHFTGVMYSDSKSVTHKDSSITGRETVYITATGTDLESNMYYTQGTISYETHGTNYKTTIRQSYTGDSGGTLTYHIINKFDGVNYRTILDRVTGSCN